MSMRQGRRYRICWKNSVWQGCIRLLRYTVTLVNDRRSARTGSKSENFRKFQDVHRRALTYTQNNLMLALSATLL